MTRCAKCGQRAATVNWVGEGGVLAYVHGMSQRWCDHCAVSAQLDQARAMAQQVPQLEARLETLEKAG